MRIRIATPTGTILILPFLFLVGASPERIPVGFFSTMVSGSTPQGWSPLRLGDSGDTVYTLTTRQGETSLQAVSQASASALITKVDVDPNEYPFLNWNWKIQKPISGGDWRSEQDDDFPVRLFVIFEKKGRFFSRLSGAFKSWQGGFSGLALNYVWTNPGLSEQKGRSLASKDVQMIAVESGSSRAGTWVQERRNIVEDYRQSFGDLPGKVIAVALMTDTDNTGNQATSYYGDIFFSAASGAVLRR